MHCLVSYLGSPRVIGIFFSFILGLWTTSPLAENVCRGPFGERISCIELPLFMLDDPDAACFTAFVDPKGCADVRERWKDNDAPPLPVKKPLKGNFFPVPPPAKPLAILPTHVGNLTQHDFIERVAFNIDRRLREYYDLDVVTPERLIAALTKAQNNFVLDDLKRRNPTQTRTMEGLTKVVVTGVMEGLDQESAGIYAVRLLDAIVTELALVLTEKRFEAVRMPAASYAAQFVVHGWRAVGVVPTMAAFAFMEEWTVEEVAIPTAAIVEATYDAIAYCEGTILESPEAFSSPRPGAVRLEYDLLDCSGLRSEGICNDDGCIAAEYRRDETGRWRQQHLIRLPRRSLSAPAPVHQEMDCKTIKSGPISIKTCIPISR